MLQDKCLAVFYLPPTQIACLFSKASTVIITGNLVGGPHGHPSLHTFGCIQWECNLFNGRPKARRYPFDIQGHRFRNKNPKVHPFDLIDRNTKYRTLYRTLYRSLYRMVYHIQCFGSSYFSWTGLCLPGSSLPIQVGAVGGIRSYCRHGYHGRG